MEAKLAVPERDSHTRIAVIADDLTGATDTGVQFAKRGLQTIVLMGTELPPGAIEENVVVMDSQSRSLTPDEAYRKVAGTAALVQGRRFPTIFKKIDSTLRGNIGPEIDAIMDVCGQELAVVAPAFPKNGRTTVGGYLLLHGAPLEATEVARDPLCPITESHIPTLLFGQTTRKVGHVGIKPIVAGPEGILKTMENLLAAGERVIVCDAWHDDHLQMVAAAAARLDRSILWVGSAGLAEHLPSVLGLTAAPPGTNAAERNPAAGKPVIVLAGSVSAVTRDQVRRLTENTGIVSIAVDPCELLQPDAAAREIGRCLKVTLKAVTSGQDVVLTTGSDGNAVDAVRAKALPLNLSLQETSERIAVALGELCRGITTGTTLSGLVLTGGDVARGCCSLLSATGFKVVEEVAPGIPLGVLTGGPCDGLRVVTKAGAFGAEDALCKAVDCLKQEKRQGAEK
jgi:D-threonate/D-erythronate kinase